MKINIKNEYVSAEIDLLGAEMLSCKLLEDNCEYLWNGNTDFWGGHAPILFPIVCALNEGKYRVDGKEFALGNHGFAKKTVFDLVDKTEETAVFRLASTVDSLALYPFEFELFITYQLVKTKISITYKVVNKDNKTVYFQIGTHPGFNCPLTQEETF